MSYRIELSEKCAKVLDKMLTKDKHNFGILITHIKNLEQNPEYFGKPLTGNMAGLWSYRVGNFRIIYQIQNKEKVVFIITIGHRREVYE